jgi:hypothetical protein
MKSGKPKKAPKVKNPNPKGNYMKEYSNNDVRSKYKKGQKNFPQSTKKLAP